MNTIITTIKTTMTTAAKDVAPAYGVTDVDAFLAALMERMDVSTKAVKKDKKEKKVEEKPAEALVEDKKEDKESVKSDGRKRVVSKKMKETFMTLQGATEEKLNEVVKAYKEAAEVTSFDAFARQQLGIDAPEGKKKAEKKPKKEKSGRLDKWTPTSNKLFKTIVEESGGAVTDDLKKEFVTWLDALDDEVFANASIQGHMRAFVTTKLVTKEAPAAGGAGAGAGKEDEDEDLEEIEFEGESLLIGTSSGKIYQPTDAGDVLIGYAGKGRFADVKKPE